ncbi:MAG TPA: aminoglycoside 3'-phosphotransferase [Caulobacteraceae bacterium]|jgi:aminoglycoside phosphotransferase|nr:aminoglycoside 3'-phosphotransferase [Caulobacteraceae bacterium]
MISDAETASLIAALCAAAGWREAPFQQVGHGMSGDLAARIGGERPAFAKIADPARRISREGLAREIAAMRWLDGRAGAPGLLWAGAVDGRPAMLAEALPGVALHELPPDRAEAGMIATVAALRALHALPITDCPLDQRLPVKLAEAWRRVEEGEVHASEFDPDHTGRAPADLWREMMAAAPDGEELVFTHGDASLPNFIVPDLGPAGVVDLGLAGVSDRYQDFALFLRSSARNFPGLDARALLMAHYPLAEIDERKLTFYRRLDEFY